MPALSLRSKGFFRGIIGRAAAFSVVALLMGALPVAAQDVADAADEITQNNPAVGCGNSGSGQNTNEPFKECGGDQNGADESQTSFGSVDTLPRGLRSGIAFSRTRRSCDA